MTQERANPRDSVTNEPPEEPIVAAADAGAEVAEAAEHARLDRDLLRGTLLGLTSAVLYTCTNACLRYVSHCDVYWVSCLKAFPTMTLAAVILLLDRRPGRKLPFTPLMALGLYLTGLLAHVGGNVAFQWGLGIVGLAATVPLTFSLLLIAGALLSKFWLGEAITRQTVIAITLLTGAFICVCLHTRLVATRPVDGVAEFPIATVAWAVAAVCFSGIAYAVLGAVVRRTVTGTASVAAVLFMIGFSGVTSLGGIALGRMGLSGILATTPGDWAMMLTAGTLNAVAFFALTRAMQLVTVSYVNIVNASQVAMAAVAGVVLFHERTTLWLAGGLALTVAGLVTNRRPSKRR